MKQHYVESYNAPNKTLGELRRAAKADDFDALLLTVRIALFFLAPGFVCVMLALT